MNRISHCTAICMLAIVALAIVWNVLAADRRDQARRDRARAQAALHRQASAFRRERDVSADAESRLTRINRTVAPYSNGAAGIGVTTSRQLSCAINEQ
jgi:hypothetical protein